MNITRAYLCIAIFLIRFLVPAESSEFFADSSAKFDLPAEILAGSELSIRLNGLSPGKRVRIEAQRLFGRRKPKLHRSRIIATADSDGTVDLSRQAPIAGSKSSYSGIEPLGLLWSMEKLEEENESFGSPEEIKFQAFEVSGSDSSDPVILATATMKVRTKNIDVVEVPLSSSPELAGAFVMFEPSEKPLPVIISLGGSEGDDIGARMSAPTLASQGFAVVGFPYYSPAYGGQKSKFPELPRAFTEIPVDRLEKVLDAIAEHPQLDVSRVGLHGVSKGGEFVLAAASRIDRFRAVAAIVPSDVIWEGWGRSGPAKSSFSFRGKPLPFVPYKGMEIEIAKLQDGKPANMRKPHDAGRAEYSDRLSAARIAVEDINAALMVVGGDRDSVWDSGGMCRNIVSARKQAGLRTEAWISNLSDHFLAGHAYDPMPNTPEDAAFRTKIFPAMIAFFDKNLKPAIED